MGNKSREEISTRKLARKLSSKHITFWAHQTKGAENRIETKFADGDDDESLLFERKNMPISNYYGG